MVTSNLNTNVADDEELNLLPASKSKSTSASTKPTDKSNGRAADLDGEVSWGSKDVTAGDGLIRLKATEDSKKRFAFIKGINPKAKKTHFEEAEGKTNSWLCDGVNCKFCKRGKRAGWSIAALVVSYENANDAGVVPKGTAPDYAIRYINLSATNFKKIAEDAPEDKQPTDCDYIQSYDGRRYAFTAKTEKAPLYVRNGDEETVTKMAKPYEKLLINKVGRKYDANADFDAETESGDLSGLEDDGA